MRRGRGAGYACLAGVAASLLAGCLFPPQVTTGDADPPGDAAVDEPPDVPEADAAADPGDGATRATDGGSDGDTDTHA